MKSLFANTVGRISNILVVGGAAAWLGCAGAAPKPHAHLDNSSVRVTEIHFNPSDGQGHAEFIEIANVGSQPVDLSGWAVTGAGRVSFPKGKTLAPGQAAVLCKDTAAVQKAFGAKVAPIAVFTGKLKGKGDTVRIEDPSGKVADEAAYQEGKPAVKEASNTGRSLHRVKLTGDASTIWQAADPTPGTSEPIK